MLAETVVVVGWSWSFEWLAKYKAILRYFLDFYCINRTMYFENSLRLLLDPYGNLNTLHVRYNWERWRLLPSLQSKVSFFFYTSSILWKKKKKIQENCYNMSRYEKFWCFWGKLLVFIFFNSEKFPWLKSKDTNFDRCLY